MYILGKFGPKSFHVKLKIGTKTDSNMQNSMFFRSEILFLDNMIQKFKMVSLD